MNQFDVLENLNERTRDRYPFVVVLQHDRTSSLITVIVAPLHHAMPPLMNTRLHPALTLDGRQYVVMVEELAAVLRPSLGRVVGTTESMRDSLIQALDLLFTGF